jgi:hypothetical protein
VYDDYDEQGDLEFEIEQRAERLAEMQDITAERARELAENAVLGLSNDDHNGGADFAPKPPTAICPGCGDQYPESWGKHTGCCPVCADAAYDRACCDKMEGGAN